MVVTTVEAITGYNLPIDPLVFLLINTEGLVAKKAAQLASKDKEHVRNRGSCLPLSQDTVELPSCACGSLLQVVYQISGPNRLQLYLGLYLQHFCMQSMYSTSKVWPFPKLCVDDIYCHKAVEIQSSKVDCGPGQLSARLLWNLNNVIPSFILGKSNWFTCILI